MRIHQIAAAAARPTTRIKAVVFVTRFDVEGFGPHSRSAPGPVVSS